MGQGNISKVHFPFQVAAHNFAIGADDAAAYAEVGWRWWR